MPVHHTYPVPDSAGATRDLFASVLVDAPAFEGLQRVVTYPISLDMVMDALRQGIGNAARRTRRLEARALFQQCLEQVDAVHRLYVAGRIDEARVQVWEARTTFQRARTVRSTSST